MQTRKPDITGLTMEEFEKGLVLAGLLTPRSVAELEEIELLRKYEEEQARTAPRVVTMEKSETPKSPKAKKDPIIYFKRAVLAAEIVSTLHREPTFGRIKFQKLFYLCEYAAFTGVQEKYQKQAAGPFDPKFMHSIVHEFRKQKWFDVIQEQRGRYNVSIYKPLEGCDKYKMYYTRYFEKANPTIQRILTLFRKLETNFTEISATLSYCYHEMQEGGIPFTEAELLRRFYDWSPRKSFFKEDEVLQNWAWMKSQQLVQVF